MKLSQHLQQLNLPPAPPPPPPPQGAVAEGVLTSRSCHHLAQRQRIECPVLSGIYRVIHEGADPVGCGCCWSAGRARVERRAPG